MNIKSSNAANIVNVWYNGKLCNANKQDNKTSKIAYPTTHSMIGPLNFSYVKLPRHVYSY